MTAVQKGECLFFELLQKGASEGPPLWNVDMSHSVRFRAIKECNLIGFYFLLPELLDLVKKHYRGHIMENCFFFFMFACKHSDISTYKGPHLCRHTSRHSPHVFVLTRESVLASFFLLPFPDEVQAANKENIIWCIEPRLPASLMPTQNAKCRTDVSVVTQTFKQSKSEHNKSQWKSYIIFPKSNAHDCNFVVELFFV